MLARFFILAYTLCTAGSEITLLYSNLELKSKEKTFDFGTIHQIAMGEYGRGRKYMTITCPSDTTIQKGMNPEYSVGITKSGKPRIIRGSDSNIYMLLSAKGRRARKGCGTIRVLSNQIDMFKVLARGKGADGVSGNMGYWDCMLIKAPYTGSIVRVRTSGGGYGTPSDLYLIHNGIVLHSYLYELEECCNALGIEVPCNIVSSGDEIRFGKDWVIL